jgi:hypothetical protein
MSEFHIKNTFGELVPKAWRWLLPAFMSSQCLGFDAIDCLLHTVLQGQNGKRFFKLVHLNFVMFMFELSSIGNEAFSHVNGKGI